MFWISKRLQIEFWLILLESIYLWQNILWNHKVTIKTTSTSSCVKAQARAFAFFQWYIFLILFWISKRLHIEFWLILVESIYLCQNILWNEREIWNWEKWKHELVLWRMSWCFMFFFHGYSMLSPNILSGVFESIKIDKNFIWSLLELQNAIREILHFKKRKHELVLWRTSWCFMFFFMATLCFHQIFCLGY